MMKRLLSLILAIVLMLSLTACKKTVQKNALSTQTDEGFYQQLDALLLTAAVCQIDPQSTGYDLAEKNSGLQLTMTVNASPATFDLQSRSVTTGAAAVKPERSISHTSVCLQKDNGIQLLHNYASHLASLGAAVTVCYETNLDLDSAAEYFILVENFAEIWLSKLNISSDLRLCLVADAAGDGRMVIHSAVLPEEVSQIKSVRWDNGMVHILYGNDRLYRIFAGEQVTALEDYRNDIALLRKMCARYVTYIADQGYTDIHIRLADISAAPGQEVICCYSDGNTYLTSVLTAHCGRLIPLYNFLGTYGALFVVVQGNTQFLMEYVQKLESNHAQTYSYRLFRFDEFNTILVDEEAAIQIAADEGGGESGRLFFERINQFLQTAQVCYDPYVLTGYEVMVEQPDEEMILPESKYLRISNCNTNKTGIVKVSSEDSWLNFRTGPSTDYDLVLIDPSNPKSFVKQTLGSPMTVMMPENTGDAENPIWVHIRISYGGRTLEGYSSERYVTIEGIKHISAGDNFTVTADTNDTGLRWTCSDPSVASIDPTSGTLTALRTGLVLISVTSDSGLEDSCLIRID